jgi:hypothetical protein
MVRLSRRGLMDDLVFAVRSSSNPLVYQLRATRTATGVRFSCSCPAGDNGQHCKHRGDVTAIAEGTHDDVLALAELVRNSQIVTAMREVEDAEKAVAAAQRNLKKAKQALGRAMMG